MKIVALDVGEKRIGVAAADTAVKIAVPHSTIEVDGTEFAQIAKVMREEGAKHLVVGLPRNAQGEESAQSMTVRSFIIALQDYFVKHGVERPLVKFQDESLTSVQAEENLEYGRGKKRRAKGEIDREAATLILQDFLDGFGYKSLKNSFEGTNRKGGKTPKQTLDENGAGVVSGFSDVSEGKKKSRGRGKVFKVFAVIIALLVVGTVGAVVWYTDAIKAVDASNCRDVRCDTREFVILEGESVGGVAENLMRDNLIRSDWAFRIFLKLERRESAIKAGVYTLNNGMTVAEIVEVLNGGSERKSFKVEVLPGETVEAVKRSLVAVGYDEAGVNEAFARKYHHDFWDGEDLAVSDFLYAGVYEVRVDSSVEGLMGLMLSRLAAVGADNNLKVKYTEAGLSFRQAFQLAVRVRTEVGEVSERGVKEIAKAAELIRGGDTAGKADMAADFYALIGVAYYESKLPFIVAGDYAGWMEVYGELARRVGAERGIPYEAILAQSIWESGWGKSKLAYKYFNFFGIKYVNMPNDPSVRPSGSVNMKTWEEYEPGVSTTINADFATWSSVEQGFNAYAVWIRAQSRYAQALKYPNDPIRYIEELKRAGYATDSNYVAALVKIIESLRAVNA
jgi:putative transcription antitermination factor YqgF